MVNASMVAKVAGIVIAVVVVIFIFRQIKAGSFIIEGLQGTGKFFTDLRSAIEGLNPFTETGKPQDNKSSLAGTTTTLPDGSKISIPPDTKVNPDGTVSSSTPPLIDLPDDVEKRVIFERNKTKRLAEANQELIDKLTEEQVKQLQEIQTDLLEIPKIRDTQGFLAQFTSPIERQNRILSLLVNPPDIRDAKTGEKLLFGGFGSVLEQEKALTEEIRKAREANPEFFEQFDAQIALRST